MTAPGAAAEYVAAPAENLAAAPRTVELAEASVLPVAALTAWQALHEHAELQAGQRILVHGAGGAVGGFAVQLAADIKADITATVSPRNRERVRSYGIDDLVDHTATPVHEALAGRRFDVVLNLVRATEAETASLLEFVADGGRLVSTTGQAPDDAERGVRMLPVFLHPDGPRLAELAERVDAGRLRIHVAAKRPLAELPAVHSESIAGRLAGKTVLIP